MEDDNTIMQNFVKKFKSVNTNNPYIINQKINKNGLKNGLKTAIWFTDGSCTGNGKKSANGGYAAVCVNGHQKGLLLFGKVNTDIKATNIRAECYAILTVLENMLQDTDLTWNHGIIYSDSEFWIKMVYDYMPKWKAANFDLKANPDLTKKLWKIWQQLHKTDKMVEIVHVFAHNKDKSATSTDPFKRFCHDNNQLADELADIARNLPSGDMKKLYI